MARKRQEITVHYRPVEYATEEEAAAALADARERLKELARIIARLSFRRHYQELMETGRNRWLSLDPNVDWEKHDAEWADWDAAEEAKQNPPAQKRKSGGA